MEKFTQTWWNKNLPKRTEEFKVWIGDSNAETKVFCRKHVKEKGFKSLIDLGCGTATEYFAYKEEYPRLEYLGIDSCTPLYEINSEKGVPMWLAPAEETGLKDNHSEVTFIRHILEHQTNFWDVLNEAIRLASKEVIIVFFIPPRAEKECISYDPTDNLYHNRYNSVDIEGHLKKQKKVSNLTWKTVGSESVLIIRLKW